MRWILIVVAVLLVLVLAVVAIGYSLPVRHVAAVSAVIPAPPESVWAAITDPESYPKWRPGVSRVERFPSSNGRFSWRETTDDGVIEYTGEVREPTRHFVARIASTGLPFGGAWDYELAPSGTGTRVTITERGEVYNPVFRFASRFVLGHTRTLTDYMKALGRRFGSEATPEVVPAS